jgi:predicted ATPase
LFESLSIKQYGRGATSPFELDVIIKGKALNINNVGYGVSQSLPVIVELFARPKGACFTIQQPEVHLHPKAQAFLGDLFFELAVKERKKFFVETHADFAIDRFRLKYLDGNSSKPKAQVLFFERGDEGNRAYQLEIAENGKLPLEQPKGYRDFFIRENMKLLDL